MNKKIIMMTVLVATLAFSAVASGTVTEVKKSVGANDTKDADPGDNVTAFGGNITSMDLSLELGTSHWTGYFGSVTNTLVLEGTGNNIFYDWGSFDSTGTVLFSNSSSVTWTTITGGTGVEEASEDTELGLSAEDDSVASTFTETNQNTITLSGTDVIAGTASSLNTSNSTGDTPWETVFLVQGTNRIYAGPIQQNGDSYANTAVDYQVMVPVADSNSQRVYYLFAELA